ncbi:MAG: nucleoside 2-deoxyribosyltransferase [Candidatus Bathyarchaeota archaeon]|nr:nucleoside 2-deoxyribosyltransferase [Candidatus Termiticorpusculum sp.]MCL1970946.1 nucleoside 2-deoxyribosyltransferase [Candidatus Termiticorpusculum sp.]
MKKHVFISGPILGMEDNQNFYRNTITTISQKLGFEVIDPWKREKCDYTSDTEEHDKQSRFKNYGRIVQRDLDDADRCDIMVVYLPKLSAGACMEMFYAKHKGKTVIVISDMPKLSPWIKVHCDILITNFDMLEETLHKFK